LFNVRSAEVQEVNALEQICYKYVLFAGNLFHMLIELVLKKVSLVGLGYLCLSDT